jgi:hypothetical protein
MRDNNMIIQSSEHILLTGAGFTKNFGGLLASEMWATIFNHKKVQAHPKIKEEMLKKFDYESIYTSIMEGSDYTKAEKEAIDAAVKSAYDYIDTIIREYDYGVPYPPWLSNVTHFIAHFNENGRWKSSIGPNNVTYHFRNKTSNKSFIFTLNQDLFFERLYSNSGLSIPGIKNNPEWFTTYFRKELDESDYCQLPNEEELNPVKLNSLSDGYFFLIKLHGSSNWKSYDGTQKMVIGSGKPEQIQKEPLLRWYFEIFKKVLSQNQRRLLIIGYGFGDDHINRIISDAVRDYELKIYIISPDSPENFKTELFKKTELGRYIWQGISGYFQHSLMDIFPESAETTQAGRNLSELFFEQV